MDKILDSLESEESLPFRKAKQINDEYVERIKIFALRADDYNPQKAASRIVSFFAFKSQLFGEESLGREILWTDLEDKDMECCKQGTVQMLKERDRSGRTVIVMIGPLAAKYGVLSLVCICTQKDGNIIPSLCSF